ncbi:hypothetical protein ACS0TY_013507 [Phlomoides rotata]
MQQKMVEIENSSPKSLPESHQTKKKRNLPGMPDPDAEVIALSPKTLMATNRFVCEICNKGFQRDQNLQLHRRGHNLPWKLRQRTSKEPRKRVYVCPETSCVHHDPSRALGDLTGIKKHFCRKHGEKKYKCERCSKKYAVQSDWKAHMKTCGTREYRCDCGTLFSRRDSFITHRAFCDALAQESGRSHPLLLPTSAAELKVQVAAPPSPPPTPSTSVLSPVLSIQSSADQLPENQNPQRQPPPAAPSTTVATTSSSSTSSGNVPSSSGFMASVLNNSSAIEPSQSISPPPPPPHSVDQPVFDPVSLSLSSSMYGASSLFPNVAQNPQPHYVSRPQPALSATALLQKAAQMGATSSNSSFLRGLGLAQPDPQHNISTMALASSSAATHWNGGIVKLETNTLGLGLPSSSFNEMMMSSSTLFGSKPATLDFLGLGVGAGEASPGGFSAFLMNFGGGAGGETWDDSSDQKPPSML